MLLAMRPGCGSSHQQRDLLPHSVVMIQVGVHTSSFPMGTPRKLDATEDVVLLLKRAFLQVGRVASLDAESATYVCAFKFVRALV